MVKAKPGDKAVMAITESRIRFVNRTANINLGARSMSDIRTLDDRGFADGLVAIATGLMLGALYVAISWRLIAAGPAPAAAAA
jgi:hypothetical protein